MKKVSMVMLLLFVAFASAQQTFYADFNVLRVGDSIAKDSYSRYSTQEPFSVIPMSFVVKSRNAQSPPFTLKIECGKALFGNLQKENLDVTVQSWNPPSVTYSNFLLSSHYEFRPGAFDELDTMVFQGDTVVHAKSSSNSLNHKLFSLRHGFLYSFSESISGQSGEKIKVINGSAYPLDELCKAAGITAIKNPGIVKTFSPMRSLTRLLQTFTEGGKNSIAVTTLTGRLLCRVQTAQAVKNRIGALSGGMYLVTIVSKGKVVCVKYSNGVGRK
jgi:hypothetical protein